MLLGAIAIVGTLWAAPASAADRECLVTVAGPTVVPGQRDTWCTDGDAACDADGAADGACEFDAALCFNGAGCDGARIERLRLRGRAAPALASVVGAVPLPIDAPGACSDVAAVVVPLGKANRARRALRVAARGDAGRDRDRVRFICERAGASTSRAVVVTSDFETGILARAKTTAPFRPKRLGTPIHADALVRIRGGMVFIVNRFLGDNVQIVDPARGFTTRLQCSTGVGSNPHDVAVATPTTGFVTRYDRRGLWVIDPSARSCGGFHRGTIDLGALADGDGLPEMSQMAVVGTRLFVALQHLDRTRGFAPDGPSLLAVVDTKTAALVDTIVLAGSNAFGDAAGLITHPTTGDLLVAQAGDIFVTGDGGIEAVDPVGLASRGFIVTEDTLGGSVTDFTLVGPRLGYAIIVDRALRNVLVRFDPATGAGGEVVFASASFMPDVTVAPTGMVWLATRPGIRVIDPVTDATVAGPIDLGLPPFSMGFWR